MITSIQILKMENILSRRSKNPIYHSDKKSTMDTLQKKNIDVQETVINQPQENSFESASVYKLFYVDDDPAIRAVIKHLLKDKPYINSRSFVSGEECIAALSDNPAIVLVDYNLSPPGGTAMDGLETLVKIKELNPKTKVIMLSSQKEISVAVKVLKHGAVDYIIKDRVMQMNVINSIIKIIKNLELKNEIQQLSETIKRDKLLFKGYTLIILLLVFCLTFFMLG